ncbi:MAG: phage tail tape measure protein [Alistipes sp.]|nr:phage tail tape measure protein [Alistipes sp.]
MQITVIFDVINKATRPLRDIDTNFKGITRTMNQLQGCMWKFNQTSELLERMGQTVSEISQPYRWFEQSMADLSALTGLVGDDLKRLGEIARQTGVASGLGASGAVEAFKLLASQIQVDDIGMEGLIQLQKETITLSQAAGMSMADAANAMAGTINQFGLQASEANRVINVLAAGSKYGAAEIPDLAMSFKVVGAAANAAGLDIEATAGAIEVLSKNNLKGAEAGTALRNILLKMQTEMGVDFNKTSMAEALTMLKPRYKDAAYMSKLFGMENMAAAQFLVANAEQVEQMTRKVTDTQTATEQATIATDTWNHRLKVQAARLNEWSMRLTESVPGIMNMIQVGSQAMSMLTSLSPLFSAVMGGIKGVATVSVGAAKGLGTISRAARLMNAAMNAGKLSTYTALITRYGAAGRIAAAAVWAKNAAVTAWSTICTAANAVTSRAFWLNMRHATAVKLSALWTTVCSKAQMLGAAITSLWSKRTAVATVIQGGLTKALRIVKTTMMTGVLPALGGVIASTWAWTAALLANPITWIVLAIVALIAALVACWQKFAEFRAVILTIWDAVKDFGKALFQWLVAPIKAAWKMVAGIGKALGALFSGDFSGAWDSLKEGFGNAADEFRKPIQTTVEAAGNISGNYDRHITEERAKQQEREERKRQPEMPDFMPEIMGGWQAPQAGAMPDYMPQITGYDARAAEMANIPAPILSAETMAGVAAMSPATTPNVSVNYTPNINISSEMTQKSREDLMKVLKDNAAEFARIIREEFRKTERGAYGLS